MEGAAASDALTASALAAHWSGKRAWCVLDAAFGDGLQFLSVWHAWREDPQRPGLLHYVGLSAQAPRLESLCEDSTAPAWLRELSHTLAQQCVGLGAGFQRIVLDGGRVSLTLCLGAPDALLTEHTFHADTVLAHAPRDKWEVARLARRCKRGSRLVIVPSPHAALEPQADTPTLLHAAGFVALALPNAEAAQHWQFAPTWQMTRSRNAAQHATPTPARCAIVGAGIAGACVAHALALRGWQVTVFDQEATPAAAASGLPAGLVVPHVSADDSPRSRLSRSGTRLMLHYARSTLVQDQDWAPSGVLERRGDAPALWHKQAGWLRPASLVRARLAQSGVAFVGNAAVHSLTRSGALWQLRDAQGEELGSAELVVLANALGCAKLLRSLPSEFAPSASMLEKISLLHAVHGTLSGGTYAEALPHLPATPINGHGCFLPHCPSSQGEQWFAGSSYETDALRAADLWTQHTANLDKLATLLPAHGAELAQVLERGPVSLWSATRCVTHDRLPLVGPVDGAATDGLWLCVGMGSRGLSLSALCAELLAARLGAEPLPIEARLARSLDSQRLRKQRVQQTSA